MSRSYVTIDDTTGELKRGAATGNFSNLSVTSTATAGGTTTLSSASNAGQRFTGTLAQTVRLPNATTMRNGDLIIIQNRSTQALAIQYSDTTTASSVPASSDQWFEVINNASATGWDTGVVNQDGSLQSQITAIQTDTPSELVFAVSGSANTFDVTGSFTFDPSNLVRDIIVYRNVSRQYLSPTGLIADGHYKKLSSTSIQFLYAMSDGDKVIIRKERSGGGLDLRNIGVNPRPAVSGNQSLGENTRLWSGIFVKDKQSGLAYEVGVSGGVLVAILS